jgi:hypothetical protein
MQVVCSEGLAEDVMEEWARRSGVHRRKLHSSITVSSPGTAAAAQDLPSATDPSSIEAATAAAPSVQLTGPGSARSNRTSAQLEGQLTPEVGVQQPVCVCVCQF